MSRLITRSANKDRILWDLIHSGPSNASQVSSRLEYPKNKTYDLLKELCDAKLVETIPRIYGNKIYDVNKKALLEVIEKRKRNLKDRLQKVGEFERDAASMKSKMNLELLEDIWAGPPEEALSQTIELLREAKSRVYISTYAFLWFKDVKSILAEKLRNQVDVHVLIPSPDSRELISAGNAAQIQQAVEDLKEIGAKVTFAEERVPFRGTIIDDHLCVFMMFSYNKERDTDVSKGYCVCRNNAVVGVFKGYWHACARKASTPSAD